MGNLLALILFLLAFPSAITRGIFTLICCPISIIGCLYVLLASSTIPKSYAWGLIAIFAFIASPLGQRLGRKLARSIESPEDRAKMPEPLIEISDKKIEAGLGDNVMGAVSGLFYNGLWLDFAQTNEGTWLIFLNWFMASISFWVIIQSLFIGNWLKKAKLKNEKK